MSKIYPISRRQPDKYDEERGAFRNTYQGFAKCVLTDAEVEMVNIMLLSIAETDGVGEQFDEEVEEISAILTSGEKRMGRLHNALGAFDVDEDNHMTKPNSERLS